MKSIELYGKKGEHGVILVTTKIRPDLQPEGTLRGTIGNFKFRKLEGIKMRPAPRPGSHPEPDPVLFIDGKEYPYDKLSELDETRVQSMTILPKKSAAEKYGDKYANRSIMEITLKKENE